MFLSKFIISFCRNLYFCEKFRCIFHDLPVTRIERRYSDFGCILSGGRCTMKTKKRKVEVDLGKHNDPKQKIELPERWSITCLSGTTCILHVKMFRNVETSKHEKTNKWKKQTNGWKEWVLWQQWIGLVMIPQHETLFDKYKYKI